MTNRLIAGMTDILAKPDAWVQGMMAGRRTAPGDVLPRTEDARDANCFCLLGARQRANVDIPVTERRQGSAAIRAAITELFPDRQDDEVSGIAAFNDHRETKHADVLRVLTRAQEIAAS